MQNKQNWIPHAVCTAAAIILCLGAPFLYYVHAGAFSPGGTDAVSGASLDIPDLPSGNFYVYVNTSLHPGTAEDWKAFFTEKEVGVIMEDIHCLTVRGDAAGNELAERYRARLAENQMQITEEDGTLVVSRAENGMYDVVVVSADAAAVYDYSRVEAGKDTMTLKIEGAGK